MNIVITGGSFSNKGASTMLYITSQKLHSKFPNANVYYCSAEKRNPLLEKEYDIFYLDKFRFLNELGSGYGMGLSKKIRYSIINVARKIKFHTIFNGDHNDYQNILNNTRLIFDISGFALSSKFSHMNYIATDYFLDFIEYAHNREISTFLMPQSFGPFDYAKGKERKIERIKKVMSYPVLIFAREKSGFNLLRKELGLNNTRLSNDLVLQEKEISNDSRIEFVDTNENVALVPNVRLLSYLSTERLVAAYAEIIKRLLSFGKNVYLFPFAGEDVNICNELKNIFTKEEKVRVLPYDMKISECEATLSKFQYIVASRYHSIVHGYRVGLPCVCIGWADKYIDLLSSVEQIDYLTDVSRFDLELLLAAIDKMNDSYLRESECIKENVSNIQSDNCFDVAFEEIDAGLQ